LLDALPRGGRVRIDSVKREYEVPAGSPAVYLALTLTLPMGTSEMVRDILMLSANSRPGVVDLRSGLPRGDRTAFRRGCWPA